MTNITKEEVLAVQKAWGEGIVAIAKAHAEGGDFKARAKEHINSLYAYGLTDIMFKPTLAAQEQFRGTYEGALSYFIGSEDSEDSGFAIKGWTAVGWDVTGIYTNSESATSMGNYFFTAPDGSVQKVEFSFGYIRGEKGELKINLHHSSLPYNPA